MIGVARAMADHGVVIGPGDEVDAEATAEERLRRRGILPSAEARGGSAGDQRP